MDLVQQRGDALHLVDDDHAVAQRLQLAGEAPDVGEVGLVERFVEQIDDVRLGKGRPQPRALPRPAGPEQEEGALRRREQAGVGGRVHHAVILSDKMTAS